MTHGGQLQNKWEQVVQVMDQDRSMVPTKIGTSSQILTLKSCSAKYLGRVVSNPPILGMTLPNHDLDLVLLRKYNIFIIREV